MRYFKDQKRFLTLEPAQKLTVLAKCITEETNTEHLQELTRLYNRIESLI
jgi:hypothetical protein